MRERNITLSHCILLQNITILSTESKYIDHIIREAIEIELHLKHEKEDDI
jgi:hypothetical protein